MCGKEGRIIKSIQSFRDNYTKKIPFTVSMKLVTEKLIIYIVKSRGA